MRILRSNTSHSGQTVVFATAGYTITSNSVEEFWWHSKKWLMVSRALSFSLNPPLSSRLLTSGCLFSVFPSISLHLSICPPIFSPAHILITMLWFVMFTENSCVEDKVQAITLRNHMQIMCVSLMVSTYDRYFYIQIEVLS